MDYGSLQNSITRISGVAIQHPETELDPLNSLSAPTRCDRGVSYQAIASLSTINYHTSSQYAEHIRYAFLRLQVALNIQTFNIQPLFPNLAVTRSSNDTFGINIPMDSMHLLPPPLNHSLTYPVVFTEQMGNQIKSFTDVDERLEETNRPPSAPSMTPSPPSIDSPTSTNAPSPAPQGIHYQRGPPLREESPDLAPIGLSPSPSTTRIRQGINDPSPNTTIAKGLEESSPHQEIQLADIAELIETKLNALNEEVGTKLGNVDERLWRMETKLGNVDERLWNVKDGAEALNQRLSGLEDKVDSMASEIHELHASMGELSNTVQRLDKGILVKILEQLGGLVNNLGAAQHE